MQTDAPHHAMRIAGEKIGAERRGDRAIDVLNPYTGAVVGRVPKASVEEVRQAFAAAHAYRPKLSRFERANILNKTAALVRARSSAAAFCKMAERS